MSLGRRPFSCKPPQCTWARELRKEFIWVSSHRRYWPTLSCEESCQGFYFPHRIQFSTKLTCDSNILPPHSEKDSQDQKSSPLLLHVRQWSQTWKQENQQSAFAAQSLCPLKSQGAWLKIPPSIQQPQDSLVTVDTITGTLLRENKRLKDVGL